MFRIRWENILRDRTFLSNYKQLGGEWMTLSYVSVATTWCHLRLPWLQVLCQWLQNAFGLSWMSWLSQLTDPKWTFPFIIFWWPRLYRNFSQFARPMSRRCHLLVTGPASPTQRGFNRPTGSGSELCHMTIANFCPAFPWWTLSPRLRPIVWRLLLLIRKSDGPTAGGSWHGHRLLSTLIRQLYACFVSTVL